MKTDMRKLSLVIWLTPLLRMTSAGKIAGIMVTLLLMIVPVNEVSAQVVQEEWVARYVTGFSYGLAPQIGLDSNGNIYVFGGDLFVPYIIKYNPDGTQLWDLNPGAKGTAIKVDDAGNVYYAAIPPTGPGDYNVDVFKYDTNGNQVWTTRTNVGTYPVGAILDIALDANFNMIVVGDIGGPKNDPDDPSIYDENDDYYVIKFDANGNKLWAQRIGRTSNIGFMYNDKPEALAVDPSGNVYVTGNSGSGKLMAGCRYFTAKLDANGNHAWSAIYASPHPFGTGFSEAHAIAVDSGGNVYVTGQSRGIGQYDWATVKYDTNGNELWAARVEGTGWDEANAIAVDNNSNVYVTGNIGGVGFGTVKYDTNGNQLWQSTYADAGAYDMALDAQGNVYVMGKSQDINYDFHYATVGYDTNGNELWSIGYNGPSDTGSDWPCAIAADNNGNVYVTGISDTPEGNEDIVTIKYSQEHVVGNTPTGSNVQVTEGDVTITFDTVTTAGDTTVTESDTGPPPPANFQTSCTPPVYYDITTTATYSGTIQVCLTYDDTACNEADMHLFHYEGGIWVDVTTSVDTVANIICGEVTILSEFLLATYTGRIFVDARATGANNGRNWADAYINLQDALVYAISGDQIWVAQGIYKPDRGGGNRLGDRNATFQLINGVAIKGGYGGFGERDPNVRDIDAYRTILSGDIGWGWMDANNSYHVVTNSRTDGTAVLDGFTITAGNANGSYPDNMGGGMYNHSGSSPTIINCRLSGNAAYSAGAMFNYGSSPTLINCIIAGNSVQGSGGGMHSFYSNLTLVNCIFSGNQATHGGAMYNQKSTPTLTNCSLSGNTAGRTGGGIYNNNSDPILTNSILWGNSAFFGTYYEVGQIANNPGSTPRVNYCCVQGWTGRLGGTGNIRDDPLFVDPPDNLRLSSRSPCIDAGDNTAVPAGTDLDGHPRIVDGDYNFTRFVDMGAYEFGSGN